jgi:transposase-like protein
MCRHSRLVDASFAFQRARMDGFPSEDAALKVMFLALRNLAKKWHTVQGWKEALNRFALLWEDRFPEQCA